MFWLWRHWRGKIPPSPWKHFGRLSLNMKNTNRSSAGNSVAAQFSLFLLSQALIRKHRRTSVGNVHILIPSPCQDEARVTMVRPLFNWQHRVSVFSYFTSQLLRPQGSVHDRFVHKYCKYVFLFCVQQFSSIFFILLWVSCLFLTAASLYEKSAPHTQVGTV